MKQKIGISVIENARCFRYILVGFALKIEYVQSYQTRENTLTIDARDLGGDISITENIAIPRYSEYQTFKKIVNQELGNFGLPTIND